MDYFFHWNNPNFHGYYSSPSSSSSSSIVAKNKSDNTTTTIVHGKDENKKKKNTKSNNRGHQVVKLSTDPQSVAARERRHRISERFKILQSLIPGGDSKNMDTVSMLEEAIQYIKFLKDQIWLHQTMMSFVDCDHDHQETHQDLLPFDQFHHDADLFSSLPHMQAHEEVLPQLGFEGSYCFQGEGEENKVPLSHDHMMFP